MSLNIIDFTLYDRVDCSAESSYSIRFARKQRYRLTLLDLEPSEISVQFAVQFDSADPKYSEVVLQTLFELRVKDLYGVDLVEGFRRGIEKALGTFYQIEKDQANGFVLIAKEAGPAPSARVPLISIRGSTGVRIEIIEEEAGRDCHIFLDREKKHIVHFPRTTFGLHYKTPKIGDRLYFIDSVGSRDVSFTREVVAVEIAAKCTCDVLHLDLPLDRLEADEHRIDGLGLRRPPASALEYCADFNRVRVFKRKPNYKQILRSRRPLNQGSCCVELRDEFGLREGVAEIQNALYPECRSPHLSDRTGFYYGTAFHWERFRKVLEPVWTHLGPYLESELVVLTSNKNRPDYLVHIDGGVNPFTASLTWPIDHCNEETISVWYDIRRGDQRLEYQMESRILTDGRNVEMTEIDRFVFKNSPFTPALLRHDVWHTVYNNSDQVAVRSLLQWRFKKSISWDRALSLVESLIRPIHDIEELCSIPL